MCAGSITKGVPITPLIACNRVNLQWKGDNGMRKLDAAMIATALTALAALFFAFRVVGQTTISETQLRPKIRVVEWYKCTDAPGPVTCQGLELYRFQLSDGTTTGPMVALPIEAKFVRDGQWIRQSE